MNLLPFVGDRSRHNTGRARSNAFVVLFGPMSVSIAVSHSFGKRGVSEVDNGIFRVA